MLGDDQVCLVRAVVFARGRHRATGRARPMVAVDRGYRGDVASPTGRIAPLHHEDTPDDQHVPSDRPHAGRHRLRHDLRGRACCGTGGRGLGIVMVVMELVPVAPPVHSENFQPTSGVAVNCTCSPQA